MKEKIKKKLLTIDQVSKISGVKVNVISSYVGCGILPYEKQDEEKLRRYYDKEKTLKRLKEIKKTEKEGFTRKEIKDFFCKKDLYESIKELED